MKQLKVLFPWTRPLLDIDISRVIRQTPLCSIFRGVFSRDELIYVTPRKRGELEAGILNLSRSSEIGTHWTAWFKHRNNVVCYYDSFGDLPPPTEFLDYISEYEVLYNMKRDQPYGTVICGQLCLCFLFREYGVAESSDRAHFLFLD